ncbi:MAG: prephenate dehydrogenase [Flaviflexus sp.]|nr:prephenate dehydrogenase [Flaviflexus sp.]
MIIRIIGSGLLGASLGLALTRMGRTVQLDDASELAAGLAQDLGAGKLAGPDSAEPDLIIVATPPETVADIVAEQLARFPHALVTDVASAKAQIYRSLTDKVGAAELSRYAGVHPMAGRERSGALAADADLFTGRPFVICPHPHSGKPVLRLVRELATDLGALPLTMAADAHDDAVARVSHMPQLVSSLLAARLEEADAGELDLAGQGLRDVTRLAGSDARLWSSIIAANTGPVRRVLSELHDDLTDLIAGLGQMQEEGDYRGISRVASVMTRGNAGAARIPGKHGGAQIRYAQIIVLVPDRPGELGRLLTDTGRIGVNIEDLTLEHSPSQPVGRAIMSVAPAQALPLTEGLEKLGWRIAANGEQLV